MAEPDFLNAYQPLQVPNMSTGGMTGSLVPSYGVNTSQVTSNIPMVQDYTKLPNYGNTGIGMDYTQAPNFGTSGLGMDYTKLANYTGPDPTSLDFASTTPIANGGYGQQWSPFGGVNDQGNKMGSIVGTGLDMGSKMFGAWVGMRGLREAEKAGKFNRQATKTQLANMAKDTNTARDANYQALYAGLSDAQKANYDTPAEQAEKNKLSGKVGG